MAIAHLSPRPATSDIVSLRDACDFFREAELPVAPRTLKKRALAMEFTVTRQGRTDYASWSDLLDAHAAMFPED